MPTLVYILSSAVAFAAGGVFMKYADGLTRLWPTVGLYACFTVGATLQTLALKRADLGVAYIVVLGLEAVLAFGLGVALFHEPASATRMLAVVLIVAGIAILR